MSYQNRQPYYHRITLLFTSTGIDEERFRKLTIDRLNNELLNGDDLFDFEIEDWDEGEPGDPADLL